MKKLIRVKGNEKMLGGVAAGIANYLDIDITLVRVLFAIGFFSPVPIVLIYIILWIVMPSEQRLELHAANTAAI